MYITNTIGKSTIVAVSIVPQSRSLPSKEEIQWLAKRRYSTSVVERASYTNSTYNFGP